MLCKYLVVTDRSAYLTGVSFANEALNGKSLSMSMPKFSLQ